MTTAEKFVTRRFPEADVYGATTKDTRGEVVSVVWQVIDDADQNPGLAKVLGEGATEADAWEAAARTLGSKRAGA